MGRRIVRVVKEVYRISDDRRKAVAEQIRAGSRPSPIYYGLMGLSVLIAGFGLLVNSPAVVIGAMLVSPLMTPIFGVALGMSMGDAKVLRMSLASMAGGVVLALVLAVLIGLLPIQQSVNTEILARTNPTILDLLVATFAGLAGSLAMLNEDVSPVLPGIALVVVVFLLTDTLVDMVQRRAVNKIVTRTLTEDVRDMTRGALENVEIDFRKEQVDVLARLFANSVPSPQVIKALQDDLSRKLDMPVNLYVSCQKADFVSAEGASSVVVGRNLDGDFLFLEPHSRTDKAKIAEQAMREWLGDRIGAVIDDVSYQQRPDGDVVYVTALIMRKLPPSQLKAMEEDLRERLHDGNLSLVVRRIAVEDFTIPSPAGEKSGAVGQREFIENWTAELLSDLPGIWVDAVAAKPKGTGWTVGADTRGSRLPTPAEILGVERTLAQKAKAQVKLLVWGQVGATVSAQGVENEEHFLEEWYQE